MDSRPRKPYTRRYVKFSPSQADNCLRELFFINTNAPVDKTTVVPWKTRRARNGESYHAGTKVFAEMPDAVRELGLTPHFELVALEALHGDIWGSAKFEVNGYVVRIEGKCDGVARYIGETIPGVVTNGDLFVVDWKSKDKLSGVNKVARMGVAENNRQQMVAYSLLRFTTKDGRIFENLDKAILHYESLQKSKEDEVASKDVLPVVVHATASDQRNLLVRFAKVVEAIENGVVPAMEPSKCAFCAYKGECQRVERGEA